MKSYVINLADRPERLAHIREIFGNANIPFERFDAIDQRRALAHPVGRALPGLRSGRPWQPFEIGCLLSHFELWKRIADGQDPYAAIFEDDVLVSRRLLPTLQGDFPRDADIVKLETTDQIIYLGRTQVRSRDGTTAFRRLKSIHEGTGAYIVARDAARRLSAAAPTFDQPLDHQLFAPKLARNLGLRVYQATPAVAIQGLLVPELRGTEVMASDRAPLSASAEPLIQRIAGRIMNQLRGARTVVPFQE